MIRKATAEDIDAIQGLFYELDTDGIRMQPEHFQRCVRSREYLCGLIQGEASDFLLAVQGGQVIGFSLLFEKQTPKLDLLVPCKYAYIQDFVVSEKHRNRGVGAELMQASKQWAKERRMEYIRLSVLPDNTDARRFYVRHGLAPQMITMECSLQDA